MNYKFDSVSIAGKISGTALDLIRRYNDLAKEAQSCGNYVDMEIYRQYAEHYRKIVTDINERRQARQDGQNRQDEKNLSENSEAQGVSDVEEGNNETSAAPVEPVPEANEMCIRDRVVPITSIPTIIIPIRPEKFQQFPSARY